MFGNSRKISILQYENEQLKKKVSELEDAVKEINERLAIFFDGKGQCILADNLADDREFSQMIHEMIRSEIEDSLCISVDFR